MILYNVTIKVDHDIHDEWMEWMKQTHIPQVLETGLFIGNEIFRLMEEDSSEGVTYAIQYRLPDMSSYLTYQRDFAPALQADHTKRYADKFPEG